MALNRKMLETTAWLEGELGIVPDTTKPLVERHKVVENRLLRDKNMTYEEHVDKLGKQFGLAPDGGLASLTGTERVEYLRAVIGRKDAIERGLKKRLGSVKPEDFFEESFEESLARTDVAASTRKFWLDYVKYLEDDCGITPDSKNATVEERVAKLEEVSGFLLAVDGGNVMVTIEERLEHINKKRNGTHIPENSPSYPLLLEDIKWLEDECRRNDRTPGNDTMTAEERITAVEKALGFYDKIRIAELGLNVVDRTRVVNHVVNKLNGEA